jgi:hypothetical protein
VATVHELAGVRVLECPTEGPPPRSAKDATDIVGAAWVAKAKMVVLSADWLGDDFFRLSTRVAGEVVQKLQDYRLRVAIVGDIGPRTAESKALRDWVGECNRGRQVWFVANLEELGERLAVETK